jgi:Peptidase family M23
MVPLTLLITLLFTLVHSAVADADRWLPPLPTVAGVRGFDFDARTPFAGGARRGVRLSGEPGETVRAPCSGRVAFAGRVPRLGSGVSLGCGRLVATAFGLRRLQVRRGGVVIAGTPIGTLGSRGRLWLGARARSARWGYRDPLAQIGGAADRPLGPAPLPLRVRLRRPDVPPPAAVPDLPPLGTSPLSPLLLAAWMGAAVAGIGAGLGVTVRRRSRRSRSPDGAPATASQVSRHEKTH